MERVIRKSPGWTIEKASSGHYKVKTPEGRLAVSIPHTASDRRALKNDVAMLRRAGLTGI